MKENELDKLKDRLVEVQEENEKKIREKIEKDKQYYEQMASDEQQRLKNEEKRKQLKEEEYIIQQSFSDKVGMDITNSKKIIGFIKRYVLIGVVTGIPGIGLTYLWDKWQENKMIKDLYNKYLESVLNSNNKDLAKEYEILRKKFCKAYDVDKIEKLVMTSDEIDKLKSDKKALEKLSEEIKKYRESYEKNLGNLIENQIIQETQEVVKETIITEDEEEPEIRR